MTSSVARIPANEWRDPGRLAAGVFARPHLKKVLLRSHTNISIPTTTTASSSTNAKSPRKMMDASAPQDEADSVSNIAWKRRQSQVLDRWAARQAKRMVPTIERQAYEAELSALATRTQPVSARAASFQPETSPALSDSSVGSTTCFGDVGGYDSNSNAGGNVIDLQPNVRASTLIQMWRELEAEAGLSPTPRAPSTGSGGSSGANVVASFKPEEPPQNSDGSDESEPFGDSESDVTTAASTEPAPHSLYNQIEKSKVGDIVKMLSSGKKNNSSITSSSSSSSMSSDENETAMTSENRAPPTKVVSFRSLAASALAQRRVRRQRDLEKLSVRMEQGQRRELEALAEGQNVSKFSYRGRLQSMLRLKSLRRQFTVQDQLEAQSTALHLDQLSNGSTISCISQKFNNGGQHCEKRKAVSESSSCLNVEIFTDSEDSGYTHSADECGDDDHFLEVASPSDSGSTPHETNSPCSRSGDPQEGSNSLDDSWDDRNLWVNNLDWQGAADSSPSSSWQDELVADELESYPQPSMRYKRATWIGESPGLSRRWSGSRQPLNHDLFESFSDKLELREILQRRTVSTALASDFCEKMNLIILAFLRRQEIQHSSQNLTFESEEWPFRRQSSQLQNFEQVASASSMLVPLQYHTFCNPGSRQHNSFAHQSAQNLLEMEVMHDLRSDIAQMHQEISDLRRLIESCMNWQAKFQYSIKQEISDAIRQSGCFIAPAGMDSTSCSSNSIQGRKGSCFVCNDMQVDSLLYRCGHMCTCYKCAYELQQSSGKCPICRSPIVDVVRAFPIHRDGS